MDQTCNQGGTYWYLNLHGPAAYKSVCGQPAVVRFRSEGMAEGHWGYRCQKHGRGYLASDGSIQIEDLAGV